MALHIDEARYVRPVNAEAGFYVKVAGITDEPFEQVKVAADAAAEEAGYATDVRMTIGYPVSWARERTQAFWYHQPEVK